MKSNIYPKLHLPPDFHKNIGEEILESKQWFGEAFVELEKGIFVQPEFISLSRVEFEIRHLGYYLSKDSIILTEFTLNRIQEILPILDKIGAFKAMTRYTSIKWNV